MRRGAAATGASGRQAPRRHRPATAGRPRKSTASSGRRRAVTAVDARPRGAALLVAGPRRALVATVLAGGAISVQSYLNGRLGAEAGSPTIGAAINNLVAFVVTVAVVIATRALPRARDRLRATGRPPLWYFLGGLGG